jgi:hypothetical protein
MKQLKMKIQKNPILLRAEHPLLNGRERKKFHLNLRWQESIGTSRSRRSLNHRSLKKYFIRTFPDKSRNFSFKEELKFLNFIRRQFQICLEINRDFNNHKIFPPFSAFRRHQLENILQERRGDLFPKVDSV